MTKPLTQLMSELYPRYSLADYLNDQAGAIMDYATADHIGMTDKRGGEPFLGDFLSRHCNLPDRQELFMIVCDGLDYDENAPIEVAVDEDGDINTDATWDNIMQFIHEIGVTDDCREKMNNWLKTCIPQESC